MIARMIRLNYLIAISLLAIFYLSGCYSAGSLYRDDVHTVYVEMFESKSFYRQVEFDLTHAVCRQIEMQTPYQLSSDRNRADTILYGIVSNVDEGVLTQQRDLDRPTLKRITVTANVSWKDLRSGEFLVENRKFKFSADYPALAGESIESAIKQITNDMARQIVEIMESSW